MFAISTPSTTPSAVPAASARPGSSVWTCTLSADESPTTRSESPIVSSVASSPAWSSPWPSTTNTVQYRYFESSWWIASNESASPSTGTSGSGSPASSSASPRVISTSPAPPASTTPASRRTSSISGVRASASSPRARTAARNSCGSRRRFSLRSPSSAISRMTVSIVPSTGRFTARYAASLAPRNARRSRGVLASSCSPRTSTKPRTIWEKMTPELPRAPMSAARESSFATAALPCASERSSVSTTERSVRTRFVPVSPSGTG